ncbi:Iron-sulfur cluster assembly scaffold protein IscU/NifU-like protein [Dissulfuribacter thermophilus]|uniref:Iron-sulfur cluster assembly scaffold protein IscU/NifU-like protein n=1 Tax=Dissulfuribacter thermophilus TaxID=1156395 RepID=A0A1B9F7L0_9BACT|nr:Iron-sulfur cluster assembly scaffold protein IscU/NifU-like protein [Dissulfuribacter thermophilus]
MYSQKVMEHFSNPRNTGEIPQADGVGEVGNPACGDMMTFYIKVKDGRIEDVKYKTFGCVAAIAVSSMVSEMVKGKTLEEAKTITNKAVAEALDGLPKQKMHCSNLGAKALKEAIKDYEIKVLGKEHESELAKKNVKRTAECTHCGVSNPITAKFCMNCGEKMED